MLRFEAETRAARIWVAGLSGNCAIEIVAGVELNARFGGPNFHHAPARLFVNNSRLAQQTGTAWVFVREAPAA